MNMFWKGIKKFKKKKKKLQNIEVTPVIKTSAVEETLKGIDPMSLSPLDALSTLIELKKML